MNINEMTLREVMDKSKSIPIKNGGLMFIFEKIVMEIESLQNQMIKEKL